MDGGEGGRRQLNVAFKLLCLYLQETFSLNNSSAMVGLFSSLQNVRAQKAMVPCLGVLFGFIYPFRNFLKNKNQQVFIG